MFRWPIVYVEVHVGYIFARVVETKESIRVECDGLRNPRTLMGDYIEVEQCLSEAFEELKGKSRWFLRPKVLIHLMPHFDGGYTNVELRAFREAGESAGFRRVHLLTDHAPLADVDIADIYFK